MTASGGRYAYPVCLDVRGRRCVVVGGGAVGADRAAGLLEAGAAVVVVAEHPGAEVEAMAAGGRIGLLRRRFEPADLAGAFLAVAATGDRQTDAAVASEARARGVLLNAASGGQGDLSLPAVIRRGPLTVAISTGGVAPALVAVLRRRIEPLFPPEYGELAELAGAARGRVPGRRHRARWRRVLDPGILALLRNGRRAEAMERVEAALRPEGSGPGSHPGAGGFVSLVGAGPGDPGLLTLAGWDRLSRADVVVYDRLADPALLDLAPPDAERIYIGKAYGRHVLEQEELNKLLVALGRLGRRVVRLKGGDPFVYGRGGEEADALAAAGIPFDVVPGVSSAVAVPAYAGIPVTDRRFSSSVAIVTGHQDPNDPCCSVDWRGLATSAGTIVVLMGVHRLEAIVAALVRCGRDPSTPAAAVERGATVRQRTIEATLEALPEAARRAGLESPAVVVVGEVVRLRARLAWFQPGGDAPSCPSPATGKGPPENTSGIRASDSLAGPYARATERAGAAGPARPGATGVVR
ncbi:MAG TPA: siroheme synthase CysG [Actinomycetota bacterium]